MPGASCVATCHSSAVWTSDSPTCSVCWCLWLRRDTAAPCGPCRPGPLLGVAQLDMSLAGVGKPASRGSFRTLTIVSTRAGVCSDKNLRAILLEVLESLGNPAIGLQTKANLLFPQQTFASATIPLRCRLRCVHPAKHRLPTGPPGHAPSPCPVAHGPLCTARDRTCWQRQGEIPPLRLESTYTLCCSTPERPA